MTMVDTVYWLPI